MLDSPRRFPEAYSIKSTQKLSGAFGFARLIRVYEMQVISELLVSMSQPISHSAPEALLEFNHSTKARNSAVL